MQRCAFTRVIHMVHLNHTSFDGWNGQSIHPNTQVAGLMRYYGSTENCPVVDLRMSGRQFKSTTGRAWFTPRERGLKAEVFFFLDKVSQWPKPVCADWSTENLPFGFLMSTWSRVYYSCAWHCAVRRFWWGPKCWPKKNAKTQNFYGFWGAETSFKFSISPYGSIWHAVWRLGMYSGKYINPILCT
jgi:hypothetical protein